MKSLLVALFLAGGTSSGAAELPVQIHCYGPEQSLIRTADDDDHLGELKKKIIIFRGERFSVAHENIDLQKQSAVIKGSGGWQGSLVPFLLTFDFLTGTGTLELGGIYASFKSLQL